MTLIQILSPLFLIHPQPFIQISSCPVTPNTSHLPPNPLVPKSLLAHTYKHPHLTSFPSHKPLFLHPNPLSLTQTPCPLPKPIAPHPNPLHSTKPLAPHPNSLPLTKLLEPSDPPPYLFPLIHPQPKTPCTFLCSCAEKASSFVKLQRTFCMKITMAWVQTQTPPMQMSALPQSYSSLTYHFRLDTCMSTTTFLFYCVWCSHLW